MCTGGGSLLKGRWLGSTTLTPPQGEIHSFPSADFATRGLKPLSEKWLLIPSELSKTVAWIVRFVSLSTAAAQASNSGRVIRTNPQGMLSHKECSSSSTTQFTASHGHPSF